MSAVQLQIACPTMSLFGGADFHQIKLAGIGLAPIGMKLLPVR